jgi:hypothetical protein
VACCTRFVIRLPSIPNVSVAFANVLARSGASECSEWFRLAFITPMASWRHISTPRVRSIDALVSAVSGTFLTPVDTVWYGRFAVQPIRHLWINLVAYQPWWSWTST